MDAQALVQALSNTLYPDQRERAEALLEEVHRLPDFTPCLLQIVLDSNVSAPTRQAGAIYLKNCIYKYWKDREPGDTGVGSELPYSIPEQAKALIRDNIIAGIIQSPPLICRQLCVCLEQVLRYDFPSKWTGIVTTVHSYLSSDNQTTWHGSLLALYQLSKKYKFKKAEERVEYVQAMKTLLPLLYERMMAILPDQSVPSVSLQHSILKIFYATMQYSLPLEIMNDTSLPGWIIVLQTVVQRPVPPEAGEVDEDDRTELEWWKCKKWALHIFCRLFERYGIPNSVEKSFAAFANYYAKTFNAGVINVILRQLEVKRRGEYVSPRVIQGIFNYLWKAVDHAASWKIIKPHFLAIFQEVIFPMMCYSDEDDQLWQDDPYEYIRMKFDIFEDLLSPIVAAQNFLASACSKRKAVLDPVMGFCVQVLQQAFELPPEQKEPRKKDGALNVIGQVAEVLMKKKNYKAQLESMLITHVYPEFRSEHGYMRARACWMLHYFSEIQFSSTENLQFGLQQVFNCLTQDKELPVKVEAAVALQFLIKHQEMAQQFVQPHVKPIIQELLVVIRETENDELTSVMEELIETYSDQIEDVAVGLCVSLVSTFNEIVDPHGQSTDEDSYKALTALGLLTAIQTLVKASFNEHEIMKQLEVATIQLIGSIFQNGVLDFYDEVLALLDLFTSVSISPQIWPMLGVLYEMFTRDGFDYFSDMMPVLYNFIKIDTETFLTNVKHVEIVITMCKSVLSTDSGELPQQHACKLLEVLVLQTQGRIEPYVPSILAIVLERLTQESRTPELRTLCLQVVIASLYLNAPLTVDLLEKTHFPDSTESISAQFLTQWIKDADLFLGVHDRKISVLGFCSLIQAAAKPTAFVTVASKIVPAMIKQMEGLVDAYKQIAADTDEEGGGAHLLEAEDDEEGVKELDSEEDDVNDEADEYLKKLAKQTAEMNGDDGSSLASSDDLPQTMMEIDYETIIDDDAVDEFSMFKEILEGLAATNQEIYILLTGTLTPEEAERVKKVLLYAEQRKSATESRQIELAGGYQFAVTSVPNAFVFSSPQ